MRELIIDIHIILNLIKGFDVGYSSSSSEQVMIDYKGKRYMVTFDELCNADDEDMFKTMNKYWKK